MKADQVEISRDEEANRWLMRIEIGGEVIRRHSQEPKDADPETLRSVALRTVADEGYTIDPLNIIFSSGASAK